MKTLHCSKQTFYQRDPMRKIVTQFDFQKKKLHIEGNKQSMQMCAPPQKNSKWRENAFLREGKPFYLEGAS